MVLAQWQISYDDGTWWDLPSNENEACELAYKGGKIVFKYKYEWKNGRTDTYLLKFRTRKVKNKKTKQKRKVRRDIESWL